MIDRAKSVRRLNHWVHLTAEFQSDLQWWSLFLGYWNGCSMMRTHKKDQEADVTIYSDASGSWGCGAAWENRWLQCRWSSSWA